jgi:hypothetical protein
MKIISGGQTGADRGALDAALAAGVECGGWCPDGRLAEDGRIRDVYPLHDLPGGDYAARTARNVQDSDGTLVITFGAPAGGTRATMDCCAEYRKPHLVIDASSCSTSDAAALAREFVTQHRIGTLNVAGPRASEAADAYEFTRRVVELLLKRARAAATRAQ